ncbi:NarK family nitrate/nitrite MFS transporter [Anaeromyxobacter sp. Fw109-5]|uniref:NarK family nitrate/nitrite MFS transporter n=1 Tax=Anaeromyxobacter sp. (strain Fw109-5) TaxID=404589 RepID=UPI0000ED6F98|nr:NarK family nitrate/nitrite MFS transporter [Anaeromyxobacter sp. Fw109-5]ABS27779.1 nitrite transporter [Anaeromyxobacter sp. Fw109-5]
MTDLVLFAVVPYVAVALAAAGLVLRHAGAGAPITARSSQVLEARLLHFGAIPWHLAILAILGAHVFAAVAPGVMGRVLGDPLRLHVMEVTGLALAGWALVAGGILLWRRLAVPRVRAVTTVMDVVVLALLVAQVGLGVYVTLSLRWGSVWYLHTAVPWLRSLASFSPEPQYASVLPLAVKAHVVLAFVLVALIPFSRLAHVVSFPLRFAGGVRGRTVWSSAPAGVTLPRPAGAVLRSRALEPQVLSVWDPENAEAWARSGEATARRNLWISIFALFLAFCVWMVWSVVVVRLPDVGFRLDTGQLFWLAALPGLSGATLRIFYSFAVQIFGGRLWTTVTTASLLVPAIGIGIAVQDPTTPYPVLLGLALLAGLGGANFASSMANIGFFFPGARKGTALGLNGGLGNLGVSGMQLVVPLAITAGVFGAWGGAPQVVVKGGVEQNLWLQNAGFVWVPFIVVAAALAWLGMDDVASARASFREQARIFRRRHTWLVSALYLGTFGSFIGFSAALPLLVKGSFPGVDPVRYAFLGPLVGALFRPVGGWLADRVGGARVTLWNFVAMAGLALLALAFLPQGGEPGRFAPFLGTFVLLFAATGIGNGSTYRMIPAIFGTIHRAPAGAGPAATAAAKRSAATEAAAVAGFASAVAAYGAFFVPKAFGTSLAVTGGPAAAIVGFVAYYALAIAVTAWAYARKGSGFSC